MSLTPFFKTGEIVEAERRGDGRVRVVIKASTDKRDADGDVFLPEAWVNDEDVSFFVQKGVIDYNHMSELMRVRKGSPSQIAEGERQALRAIIGEPVSMKVDGNALYCTADLYGENEYVKEIIPALKANSTRYGASVGGGAYPPKEITKSKYGERVYDRARLKHIAICPLMEAKNDETSIALLKSLAASLGETDAAAAPVVAAAQAEPDALLNDMLREYCFQKSDFMDFLYGKLKSTVLVGESPDHRAAREYFRVLGCGEQDAEQLATLAILHFSR